MPRTSKTNGWNCSGCSAQYSGLRHLRALATRKQRRAIIRIQATRLSEAKSPSAPTQRKYHTQLGMFISSARYLKAEMSEVKERCLPLYLPLTALSSVAQLEQVTVTIFDSTFLFPCIPFLWWLLTTVLYFQHATRTVARPYTRYRSKGVGQPELLLASDQKSTGRRDVELTLLLERLCH